MSIQAMSHAPASNAVKTLNRQLPKENPRIPQIKIINTAERKYAATADMNRGRKRMLNNPTIDTGTNTDLHISEENNGLLKELYITPARKEASQKNARTQI